MLSHSATVPVFPKRNELSSCVPESLKALMCHRPPGHVYRFFLMICRAHGLTQHIFFSCTDSWRCRCVRSYLYVFTYCIDSSASVTTEPVCLPTYSAHSCFAFSACVWSLMQKCMCSTVYSITRMNACIQYLSECAYVWWKRVWGLMTACHVHRLQREFFILHLTQLEVTPRRRIFMLQHPTVI